MRLFFGLKPDPHTCLAIDHWRERTFPPLSRPVPAQNLHLTLAFLGEVTERQLEPLLEEAGRIREPPFSLTLDQLGFYSKARVLWIGPIDTPDAAMRLAADLKRICRKLSLRSERRKFEAHLTIARRCETPPPASVEPPSFEMVFDSFSLFESTNGRTGVQYRAIAEWPLQSQMP